MNPDIEVWVSMEGGDALAGSLYSRCRRNIESATFVYDESYLSRPDAYRLDPALPLATGAHHTPAHLSLFNAFTDTSPDRWGRNLVKRSEKIRATEVGMTPRSLGEIDYLLGVRDDLRQGALRFRQASDGPFLATDRFGVPAVTDFPDLLQVAARVENDNAGWEELQRLIHGGSSLGGARPKVHVRKPDGSIAIAKFPSSSTDTWNVMAWEKVALDLAAAAGVEVPPSQLSVVADRYVLIVDRFDRHRQGQRIGYCSALTMIEAGHGDRRSYLDIAGVIEERSPSATAELRQLWRRMAFSVLISNTDDHLRNHGFLHVGSGSWKLAPAFDLNPNPDPGPKYLSTAIDDVETEASIDLLFEVAPFFRLSHDVAASILGDVSKAVSGWRSTAERAGLDREEINQMTAAFDHPAADRAARFG